MDMNYDEIFGLGDGENGEEAQSAADSAASDEDVTLGDGAGEESGGEERRSPTPRMTVRVRTLTKVRRMPETVSPPKKVRAIGVRMRGMPPHADVRSANAILR